MATSKDFAVLDLQNDPQGLGVDLQFQDFGDARVQPVGSGAGGGSQHEQTIHFTEFPDSAEDDPEQEKLMGDEEGGEPVGLKAGASFWNFEFYQQFFDVESKQVGDRIIWSMVPKPGVSYLQSYIRPNPDLYGPFWICMTLAFTTAITGNLANYLLTRPEDTYIWRYDFHKVTLAATAIFAYAWLVPLAVWGILIWRGSRAKISLLELLCIYGYSLAIFVPVSILWMVPQPWFKWCLAIVAPVLSGSVLVRTVWPSLSHDTKQVAITIAAFILILHATLALGFMLYFFTAPDRKATPVIPATPAANPSDKDGAATQSPSKNVAAEDLDAKAKEVKEGIEKMDPDKGDKVVKKDQAAAAPAPERKKQERNTPLLAENLQGPGAAEVGDKLKSDDDPSVVPIKNDKVEEVKPVGESESKLQDNSTNKEEEKRDTVSEDKSNSDTLVSA
ncbi:protein YIPF1 isoform X2 [Penaeus vannamei]|uniref:protein YIPF1 isoform X2 n=1 Tax=Penaeus vannamei TaxID=6689 RepID=UPI00387F5E06